MLTTITDIYMYMVSVVDTFDIIVKYLHTLNTNYLILSDNWH